MSKIELGVGDFWWLNSSEIWFDLTYSGILEDQ